MYDGEVVSREVYVHLREAFAAAKAEIEALWAATVPLTIPDPVTWFYGHNPVLIEWPSTAFPFVSVMSPGSDPVGKDGTPGYGEQAVTTHVDCYVVADTVTEVNVLIQRYVAVLYQALLSKRNYKGYIPERFVPTVDISEAVRHKQQANADTFDADDMDYFQGARITFVTQGD